MIDADEMSELSPEAKEAVAQFERRLRYIDALRKMRAAIIEYVGCKPLGCDCVHCRLRNLVTEIESLEMRST